MSDKNRSLRTRLMLRFSLLLLLLMGSFSWLFYSLSRQNLRHKVLAELRETALEAEGRLLGKETAVRDGVIVLHFPLHTEAALIRDGRIAARTPGYRPEICRPLEHSGKEFLLQGGERLDACYWERFSRPFSGAVVLQKRDIPNESLETMEIFAASLIPLTLILLGMAWRLIGRILTPIRTLTDSIRQVSVDNFSRTVPAPDRDDEIQALTDAYNAMILRLREGVETLERFNSDLAHELRTPLTVIRGEIELALRRDRSPEECRDVLERLARETRSIERMSEGLLLLSRYSPENVSESFETLRLDRLLEEALKKLRPLAESHAIELHTAIESPLEYRGNPTLMTALFGNLVENAIKYSPEETVIDMTLERDEGKIRFRVRDRGPGIPKAKLRHLTQRFYRADEARSRRIPGFGLGLSIAERAVTLHDGKMEIHSTEGEGTTVEVLL